MDLNGLVVEGIAAFFSIWANDLLWQTETFENNDAIGSFQAMTMPLVTFFAVAGTIVAAIRILWYRRLDPTMDLLKGILTLIIVTFAGLGITVTLLRLSTALSGYFLDVENHGDAYAEALGGALSEESQDSFLENVLGAVGSGFVAILTSIVGIVVIISLIVQIGLIYFIQSFVYVLACVLPLAASATVIPGTQIFQRVLAWTLAAIFYKPVLAFIYALGFTLMGQSEDANTYMVGVAVILLASGALPGLLKLFKVGATRVMGAFGVGGGGGGSDDGGTNQGSSGSGGNGGSFGTSASTTGSQMAAVSQGLPALSNTSAGGATGGSTNRGMPGGTQGLPALGQGSSRTADQKPSDNGRVTTADQRSPNGGQAMPASLGGGPDTAGGITPGGGDSSPLGDGAGQGAPEAQEAPVAQGTGDSSIQAAGSGGGQGSGGPSGASGVSTGVGDSGGSGTLGGAHEDYGDSPHGAVPLGGPGMDDGGSEGPRGASGDGY